MWRPKSVGEVIAERTFAFRRGKRSRKVTVRFGRPVRDRKEGYPWWCPVEVSGALEGFQPIAGEDSLQALVLALQYVQQTLPAHARRCGGTIDWLGENERPIFAETDSIQRTWHSIMNLIDGLSLAIAQLEKQSRAPSTLIADLRKRVASSGAFPKPQDSRRL